MVGIDVSTEKGVQALNTLLQDKSYISGYQPSQDDATVFNSFKSAPNASNAHVLRWYNHIKSYNADEKKKFPAGAGVTTAAPAGGKPAAPADDDDDDVDLFGSDNEDAEEAERIKAERVAAYNEKKSKKPVLIAKSSIVLDVKPWDDETDMKEMEKKVREIEKDGLLWGASKLVPVGYGINKLQIMCVVEDDKVSIDELTENIQEYEDFVQSVDIAAFNKI